MFHRFLTLAGAVILASSSLPALADNSPNPDDGANEPEKVVFFCGRTYDSASKSQVPTTLVWTSAKNGNVALVRWKSQYFDRSVGSNLKRCQMVSRKFQTLWDAGQLNLITTGTVKNLPVVCGVASEGDSCTSQNQLFTLKPFADKKTVIEQLSGIFEGKVSSPIYESGGEGGYIDLRSLLRSKPVVSSKAPGNI
jgi:hypothetical protein